MRNLAPIEGMLCIYGFQHSDTNKYIDYIDYDGHFFRYKRDVKWGEKQIKIVFSI